MPSEQVYLKLQIPPAIICATPKAAAPLIAPFTPAHIIFFVLTFFTFN